MTTYRAARLVVDAREAPVEDGCVTVEDGRVVYAGPYREAGDVHDFGDATILPGLIDAHVHLVWSAGREPHELVDEEPRAMTALRTAANANEHRRCGVTTVRDVGSTDGIAIDVAKAIGDGLVPGARVQAAGRAIAEIGGHARWVAIEVEGEDAVRRAVRAELEHGATCIKAMASGGIYGSDESIGAPQLTLPELRAAAETAHQAGVPITAHAYSEAAIQHLLDAGFDSVEHGSFLTDEQAAVMRDRGMFLVPTLSIYRALEQQADALDLPDYIRVKTAEVIDASVAAFRRALAHGVPLATGTDAGSPGHPHAGALASELEAMVDAGATPAQALTFATAGAAKLLRLDDEIGTLAPGKRADLVIVAGDPYADIARVRDVQLVLTS